MRTYTIEDARQAGWTEADAPGFVTWMNEFIAELHKHEIDWLEWDFLVTDAYEEGLTPAEYAAECLAELGVAA